MKLELMEKIQVHVLDVSMPILRSAVRNDLRLIAKITQTEHDGSLAGRNGESIREMLGMKPNSWRRVIEEGESAHRLWADNRLTDRGRKCAKDGIVLDHEDGPHRLWVIDAPEPIGMKVIHIEAWANISTDHNELGEEHTSNYIKRIRNESLEHASVIDPSNRCRLRPPSWWQRWMKRDPLVQEHLNLSTEIDLLCEWKPGGQFSTFAARGNLAGITNKPQVFEGRLDVEKSPPADQMKAIVVSALSSQLSGGQEWDDTTETLKTDIKSIDQKSIERMRIDIPLGQISDGRIGNWDSSSLKDIELRARDENSARDWIATLFWNNNDVIHRTNSQTNALIRDITSESAFQGMTFNNEAAMLDSLISINIAPEGAHWLFSTAKDLALPIGQEDVA